MAKFCRLAVVALALTATTSVFAQSMLRGDTPATSQGWFVNDVFTVGNFVGAYQPVGILDGIFALPGDNPGEVRVLVNHELNEGNGYPYMVNGFMMTGARVSEFIIDASSRKVISAQEAYDTVVGRNGLLAASPAEINEDGNAIDGFARFCSSNGVEAGEYDFVDDIYFTGEESGIPFHPHGGTEWALDIANRTMYACPNLGRGAWENVTPVDTGDANTVGLILGDDTESAPLYLWVGQKSAGTGGFIDRNGLEVGQLYVWVSNTGELDPDMFNGSNGGGVAGFGATLNGTFVPISVIDPAMAGMPGHDSVGYLDNNTLTTAADALGAFSFARPEDIATNPTDGTQVIFASTGRGGLFPSDNWGTTYLIDLDFSGATPTAALTVIHDADQLVDPDTGIRSPDNLDWASNGLVYINEDRSTAPSNLFGGSTGVEASIWELDVATGSYTRIAEVDRSVVLPAGSTDILAGSIGGWETSGVLDVTDLFDSAPGELVLIADIQAHGIRDGAIGDNPLLDEGGQLVFLTNQPPTLSVDSVVSNPGSTATLGVSLDNTPRADIQGWSFGVCNDASLGLQTAGIGADAATANGGAAPDFIDFNLEPGGYNTGVVISFMLDEVIGAVTGYELATADYTVLGAPGSFGAADLCDTIGAPPAKIVVVIDGEDRTPATVNGGVTIENPNTFIISKASAVAGNSADVELQLTLVEPIVSFQTAIAYDDALLTFVNSALGSAAASAEFFAPNAGTSGEYTAGVVLEVNPPIDGDTIPVGMNQQALVLSFDVDAGAANGAFAAVELVDGLGNPGIDNLYVLENGDTLAPALENGGVNITATEFVRGDANQDGGFNIADAVTVLEFTFQGEPTTCEDALDVNDDGSINVADAVRALDILFNGIPQLNEPFPACGVDPSSDSLTCDSFAACP